MIRYWSKFLCWLGWHDYQSTDWLSEPYDITPYRRARYKLLQCQRCCKIKNGGVFLGQVTHKKVKVRPLKRCDINKIK